MAALQSWAPDGRRAPWSPCLRPGGWGPARYYRFPAIKGTLGFIGSVSDHFCAECNRLRLTADGRLKNCLFSSHEIDVRRGHAGPGPEARAGRGRPNRWNARPSTRTSCPAAPPGACRR